MAGCFSIQGPDSDITPARKGLQGRAALNTNTEVCVCLCASVDLISNVCLSFVHIDALCRLPGYIKGTRKHARVDVAAY